jgi:hypothetical protein
MAYCTCCGTYADLDPADMCARCRHAWQPARNRPGDLGYRAQPQPPGDT